LLDRHRLWQLMRQLRSAAPNFKYEASDGHGWNPGFIFLPYCERDEDTTSRRKVRSRHSRVV
jgi:hypothetical protein